jgi:hypothetical protein
VPKSFPLQSIDILSLKIAISVHLAVTGPSWQSPAPWPGRLSNGACTSIKDVQGNGREVNGLFFLPQYSQEISHQGSSYLYTTSELNPAPRGGIPKSGSRDWKGVSRDQSSDLSFSCEVLSRQIYGSRKPTSAMQMVRLLTASPSARVVTLTFDIQLHRENGRSSVRELGRPISPANVLGCEVSS